MEAVEFAGHQGLDNLILIYDSNDVTLDAMADKTQSENTALRFKAMNWDVQTLADGHDLAAILKAINKAKKAKSGKPQLIIAKTIIGKGIPEVAGTSKGHGEGGAKFADTARAASAARPSISTSASRSAPISPTTRSASSAPTANGRRPSPPGARPIPTRPRSSTAPARQVRAPRISWKRSRCSRPTPSSRRAPPARTCSSPSPPRCRC